MSALLNDGSSRTPALKVYLNLANLADLPEWSVFPGGLSVEERDDRLAKDGFDGVQVTDLSARNGRLPWCGLDRINHPQEAHDIVARHADLGDACLTVHAGWGLEDEVEIFALVESILQAADAFNLPIFLETHRATITQDIWRTVQIAKRFPEVKFNGDFSHYYCGQEMVYGGLEMKLEFLAPVFARVGFVHGRVASPGCMQVPVSPGENGRPLQAHGEINYLADFCAIWTRAIRGFLSGAGPGDVLIFSPELLSGRYYYARLFPSAKSAGKLAEETDRYLEARELARIFLQLFEREAARP